ncbi:MAG: YbjN domain-containing protein [Myxococcota bacterium]
MTLFGDQRATELDRAVSLVEQTIVALGVDPERSRASDESGVHRFSLRRGSAALLVAIHPPAEGAESGTIRVVAPVVRMPPDGPTPELLMRLLRANAEELVGGAFGVRDGEVVLLAERSVRDLDASEVDAMIRTVGRDADRYDDALAAEFELTRASDPEPA